PGVFATATETEGLEAHRFEGNVARQDDQVGPGNLAAVLLLDRPKEPARLIQANVVRPTVEWREALLPPAPTTTAVPGAVSAGAVPRHANEQRAVVAEVRRPPLLRVGHQYGEIFFHRGQIEAFE